MITGPLIVGVPIVTICGVIYILRLLSPMALLGIIVFLLFYPIQYAISRLVSYLRRGTVRISDTRIRLVNEMLECIRLIKMYAWENHFCKDLLDVRAKEQNRLMKTAYFQSIAVSLAPAAPVISAIITFLAHVSAGYDLTAAQVFPLVSFYNTQIRNSFNNLQYAAGNVYEATVSIDRLKSILLLKSESCPISRPIVTSQALAIVNGTFVCDRYTGQEKNPTSTSKSLKIKRKQENNSEEQEACERLNVGGAGNIENAESVVLLDDVTFEVTKGKLVGVCGHVGSGKSSLLLACLGQLQIKEGQLLRDGTCAYTSQRAWIVNATLRENILFGHDYNPSRYQEAISACCLTEDLKAMPAGDRTEIGEKGINLSGGQKQRVALARAYYADRDIYFLDDPLGALDAHVGPRVFQDLILKDLRSKTVVLVTHQVKYLQRCAEIYVMRKGKIVEHGTHEELLALNGEYTSMVEAGCSEPEADSAAEKSTEEEGISQDGLEFDGYRGSNATSDTCTKDELEGNEADGKLTTAEKTGHGDIKTRAYRAYIRAAGGYWIVVLVVFAFFLNVGSTVFSSWWLAIWLNAKGGNYTREGGNGTVMEHSRSLKDNPDFEFYYTIYGASIGVILLTSFIRGFAITRTAIKASTTLHNAVLKKIIAAPMRFFETTPVGRIQNMFSRDIDEVDNRLPFTLETIIQNVIVILFAVVGVCVVFPWFMVPLVVLGALYYYIGKVFRVAARDLRRIENVSRSPIFSFITTTIQGLSSIRAFNKEDESMAKFVQLFDFNNACMYVCNSTIRWLAFRFDNLSVLAICVTALLVTFFKGHVPPPLAGLALAYCVHISGVFHYTVRVITETEMKFISVEKMEDYLRTLENEHDGRKCLENLPDDWPPGGDIKFDAVQMRYRKGLPLVLKNVTFHVKPGEKIGVVGRTGSGKSSLTTALFSLVKLSSGRIKIDNVDISQVKLELLRSKLSIVPQDPVLFSGTIRSNLDPFEIHLDAEIWEALEKTQLKARVQIIPGQLDAAVGFGGDNLSMGERQLLCLTRSLLRRSKILVLDEATAAVDPETETALEATVQQEFLHCTVLTIAHRLQTILSCDRILVMADGRVSEFDEPKNLLSNPNSEFSKLMASAEMTVKESLKKNA
ncbi:multidrug resistance-associated protein 5 isoform X2 [Orussus abietinus]|nr:multidrug resistance-associated protein 5 isoform X2 [Orussus abietinus]